MAHLRPFLVYLNKLHGPAVWVGVDRNKQETWLIGDSEAALTFVTEQGAQNVEVIPAGGLDEGEAEIIVRQAEAGYYWRVAKGSMLYGPLVNTAKTAAEAYAQAEDYLNGL